MDEDWVFAGVFIVIGIIFLGVFVGGIYKSYQDTNNCVKHEKVCYKVGCSGWGCNEAKVDCSSNNIDRTKNKCIKWRDS